MLVGLMVWLPVSADNRIDSVSRALRVQLNHSEKANSNWILDWPRLKKFYKPRDYRPVWMDGDDPLPRATLWRETLRRAELDGLDPELYHLSAIEKRWHTYNPDSKATLELLLTDAFINYSVHARAGRLDPDQVDPNWHIKPPVVDSIPLLWLTLAEEDFASAVNTLPPAHKGYQRLRAALARYRQIERSGGWPPLPAGPKLQYGNQAKQIGLLRLRLIAEGDLASRSSEDIYRFDRDIREAVKRFQVRHGLHADGVVGESTRMAMNVPVSNRIEQIKVNMERWRWLPRKLGDRYVMVNTAGYELSVVEDKHPVLNLKVITGKQTNETPVISGRLGVVQFNPYWTVPSTIAAEELLPKQQRNPDFLTSRGFRVYDKWGEDAKELDPADIEWSQYNKKNFPYKLRQDPGPKNALGSMKFLFANNFAIYLHDTPHRRLFNRETRAFSHGCIRVQHPIRLAEYLLADVNGWSREEIEEAIESGETQNVRLPAPVSLYLAYWTAWVGTADEVHFREDVYERDRNMAKIGKNETVN